jgi:ubiquinone/menaquinone biosynthesis C-methylase UbiE
MSGNIIQEQIAYYRARAHEYDDSLTGSGLFAGEAPDDHVSREFQQAMDALRALPPVQDALELACGTGIWTQELIHVAQTITAVDASPEMIAINREKNGSPRVSYECANLFSWQPSSQYDLVMFAFWLSHVPPDRLDSFLEMVRRAVRPGGRIFMVDEPAQTKDTLPTTNDGILQPRTLHNGQQFTIVKMYYDPALLKDKLTALDFEAVTYHLGDYFFYLAGQRK